MACGGCGKRRSIQVQRPTIRNGVTIQQPVTQDGVTRMMPVMDQKLCPMCRSIMRSLHRYDKSINKVVKGWYCTKPSCANSRGLS
jgi:hypothetical protein